MVRDYEVMDVLKNIANSLKSISESLYVMRCMKKSETEMTLKESRQRQRVNRQVLNESKRKDKENDGKILGESKFAPFKNVNTQNKQSK